MLRVGVLMDLVDLGTMVNHRQFLEIKPPCNIVLPRHPGPWHAVAQVSVCRVDFIHNPKGGSYFDDTFVAISIEFARYMCVTWCHAVCVCTSLQLTLSLIEFELAQVQ